MKKEKTLSDQLTTRTRHLGDHGALLHVKQHDAVPWRSSAGGSSGSSRERSASRSSSVVAAAAQQQPARSRREDGVRHRQRARDRLGGLVAQVLDRDEVGLAVEHGEAVAGDEDGAGPGAAAGLRGRVRGGCRRAAAAAPSRRAAVSRNGIELVSPALGVVVGQKGRGLGRVV